MKIKMEEEVILAINGDMKAYQNLIQNIEVYLYNIAISIVNNDEEAADAIGNTILKGYNKINTLKNPTYFKTWITRVLINECKDILRKNKKIVSIDQYYETNEQEENETITKEEKMDIMEAINKLNKKIRDVIILFYYNDLKIEEISQILNIPSGTVKSRLNTGKNMLYSILNNGGEKYNEG